MTTTPDASASLQASGLEAAAWGLLDGGVRFTTAYPGFHAQDIAELMDCPIFSTNERNAMAIAWGASLAGTRTATMFKNVGLNDAADPFLNACAIGVRAGLVVIVLDDWDLEQTQLQQDSRGYAELFSCLWLEPRSVEDAYELAREAPGLSERFSSPVVLRLTNLVCLGHGNLHRHKAVVKPLEFKRDPERWVVHPINATKQQEQHANRMQAIGSWVDQAYALPSLKPGQTTRIAMGMASSAIPRDTKPDLELFTLPLPRPWLDALANHPNQIEVWEHGADYVARKIAQARGKNNILAREAQAPQSKQEYRVHERYEPLYAILRKIERRVIIGDLGGHSMDPLKSIDACLCYGASVGVASGFASASTEHEVFCVIGDAAFLHSGKEALSEALERGTAFTVLILDNGGSAGTGGQTIPGLCVSPHPGIEWQDIEFAEVANGRLHSLLQEEKTSSVRVIHLSMPF